MSDDVKKKKTVHVRHFDHANGGKRTPAEMHRELVYRGQTCSFCGDPAAIKGMLYADAQEYAQRDPVGYFALVQKVGGDPAFDSKWGRIIRIQDLYGCDRCKTSLKQFMARKPDWQFCEFDEQGLESSHSLQVQVQ